MTASSLLVVCITGLTSIRPVTKARYACHVLHHKAVHFHCTVSFDVSLKAVCFAVAKTSGSVLGVTIGCLLGMCPLLWMDSPKREMHNKAEVA